MEDDQVAARDFGGNTIQNIDLGEKGVRSLADAPYFFYHCKEQKGYDGIPADGAVAIYVVKAANGARMKTGGESVPLTDGQLIVMEKPGATSIEGDFEAFVAGTTKSVSAQRTVRVVASSDVKKVDKPWGYELWLTGEHPQFAFKKLFIKAGTKTSLQYHNFKRETMIFWDGKAALHYRSNPKVSIDQVKSGDVSSTPLVRGDLVQVFPHQIHRVEAVSDIHLFEVSTAHLDDVVRVSDDANRANGRIAEEHKKS
jgi:mannose-6-phosphate isomerase